MAWNYGEPMYAYYPDPRFDRDGRQIHELAPVAFRVPPFYDYVDYDQPGLRYNYPDARFDRHGRYLRELPPVQPFCDDVRYRRDFRHHHPDAYHGGHMIPHREEVYLRREGADVPWWLNGDHPHGRYPVFVVERQQPAAEPEPAKKTTTVELYAPQLCCDSCEGRVVKALKNMTGVKSVTADQWNKKVSVRGVNLRPEGVLYHLHHDERMDRSVLWQDRRG